MLDLEMGERFGQGFRSANPMHENKKLERESSEKKFLQRVDDQAREVARKGLGTGPSANEQAQQGVNSEAMGRLMAGGGLEGMSLERLNITINWAQNFGLVMLFDVPWPEVRRRCGWGGEG